MPLYQAYGLTFSVPFECPSMTPAPAGAAVDVNVVAGPVMRSLALPMAVGPMFDAAPDQFLVRGGRTSGRFLVEGGNRVTYAANPEAQECMLSARFTVMVLPALLRQRGLLVLHANSTVIGVGAVAIAGDSGAGKSTTLAGLLGRGASMLSDDVTALRTDCDGVVEALPGIAELHLTEASSHGLGVDVSGFVKQPWRRQKTAVPTADRMADGPAALTAIYLLRIGGVSKVQTVELTGQAKFAALSECVYGPVLSHEGPAMLPMLSAVLDQATVTLVVRPADRWSVDSVLDVILERTSAGSSG